MGTVALILIIMSWSWVMTMAKVVFLKVCVSIDEIIWSIDMTLVIVEGVFTTSSRLSLMTLGESTLISDHSPPLAPITATFLWATELVENCLAALEAGLAILENILMKKLMNLSVLQSMAAVCDWSCWGSREDGANMSAARFRNAGTWTRQTPLVSTLQIKQTIVRM